jgi:hypothetical protein
MTSAQSEKQRKANKAVVEAYYADSQAGDPDAPNYAPLGGKVRTAQTFTDEALLDSVNIPHGLTRAG